MEPWNLPNRVKIGSECHRFETWCQQRFFTVESQLKSTLHLVICLQNINSCIGWLYICLPCERCNISLMNQSSTRVVATLWKITFGSRAGHFFQSNLAPPLPACPVWTWLAKRWEARRRCLESALPLECPQCFASSWKSISWISPMLECSFQTLVKSVGRCKGLA